MAAPRAFPRFKATARRGVVSHTSEAGTAAGLLSLGRSLRNEATLLSLGDQGSQPVHVDLGARVGIPLRIGPGKKRRHCRAIKRSNNLSQSTNQLRQEGLLALTASGLSGLLATCLRGGSAVARDELDQLTRGVDSRLGGLRGGGRRAHRVALCR